MLIFWLLQRAALHHNGKSIYGSHRGKKPTVESRTLQMLLPVVLVPVNGIEPLTIRLQSDCSTN
ncbi:hypothetical protein WI146_004978 [Escherichia coli]|nr:hypothetical protein [Escherichia coli]EFF6570658.1 hypothetical protein [Escherichia coli]EFH1181766.1 hypothetical protein [Escherichia coli]EFI1733822.1 hypothetical protein [Escherichia coli]EGZ2741833.1 hypothetical protein [Escherichia coli]